MEHVDVLVVGAGLSGIGAWHHLRHRCPWATVAVVEARGAIGGTWDLFRYPGVRSDSDLYTLGYPFRPWEGPRSIAGGDEILAYLRSVAAADGLDRVVRLGQRVVAASWSTEAARWRVTVERTATGETAELTCGFLVCCTGYYRYDRGYRPEFPGAETFAGTVVHPQEWDGEVEVAGRRVVVVGSGATAITLVPALAGTAAHVTMLQRSPTYVLAAPAVDPVAGLLGRVLPPVAVGRVMRWVSALTSQALYRMSRWRPDLVRRMLRRQLERELPPGFDVHAHFTPRYDPWDQRLCLSLDGDLFAAVRAGSVSVVTDRIETFTPTGLRLASGAELPADVVVTATGLELLFLGGMALTVDGEVVDPAQRLVYRGSMLEDVPNLALAIGYTNASWTLRSDLTCEYVCRLLTTMRRTGATVARPRGRGGAAAAGPLLGLSSGYVQRSADRFPRQGTREPWVLHQSWLRDRRLIRRRPIEDGVLRLTRPAPAPAPAPDPDPDRSAASGAAGR